MALQINSVRRLSLILRCPIAKRFYCATNSASDNMPMELQENTKEIEISSAIRSYLKNANAYKNMLDKEREQFELGRRHLANIMGEDPDNFGQQQIDEAIAYLFPSSLTPEAKPIMKPPDEIYPKKKKLKCDLNGRPLHTLYYTNMPNFNLMMREAVYELEALKLHEYKVSKERLTIQNDKKDSKEMNDFKEFITSSSFLSLEDLQNALNETLNDHYYKHWLNLMERIVNHPCGYLAMEFLSKYRTNLISQKDKLDLPEPQLDPVSGLRYSEAYGQKKWALAEVKLYMGGTGKISVNEKDILTVFRDISDREQLLFPLIFTGYIGKVNVEATVSGSGPASQSNALRLGISRALTCFLSKEEITRMRLAGLLSMDVRFKERKKPGQPKARKKHTWKAR